MSRSAWNTRFYFGHQKPCMDNDNDKEYLHSHFVMFTIYLCLLIIPKHENIDVDIKNIAIRYHPPPPAIHDSLHTPGGKTCMHSHLPESLSISTDMFMCPNLKKYVPRNKSLKPINPHGTTCFTC